MIVIGIDPGLSGAIAVVADNSQLVYDMPVEKISTKGFVKNAVNMGAVADIIDTCTATPDSITKVYIERVSAFPGQGVASMFSLGMSYGGVLGVIATFRLPYALVEPKDWKARFKLARDKELSLALARRLFPAADLGKAKHHGRAEALLIALHGRYLEKAQ